MEIRHGLISADSHVVTEPNAFPDRTSKSRFGERIPQIKEVESNGAKVSAADFCQGGRWENHAAVATRGNVG